MRHALPDRQRDLDVRRFRPVGVANGIGEQHFVVSNVYADRRQTAELRMERRGLGVRGILALKVHVCETLEHVAREDRVRLRPRF